MIKYEQNLIIGPTSSEKKYFWSGLFFVIVYFHYDF